MRVTERELNQLRPASGVYTVATWRAYYSLILGRELTLDETNDAIERIWQSHRQERDTANSLTPPTEQA